MKNFYAGYVLHKIMEISVLLRGLCSSVRLRASLKEHLRQKSSKYFKKEHSASAYYEKEKCSSYHDISRATVFHP